MCDERDRFRSRATGFAVSVLQEPQRCMVVAEPSLAMRVIASPQTGHHLVRVKNPAITFHRSVASALRSSRTLIGDVA
jgi:hypothetical protein